MFELVYVFENANVARVRRRHIQCPRRENSESGHWVKTFDDPIEALQWLGILPANPPEMKR